MSAETLEKTRILVVDDDPISAEEIQDQLEQVADVRIRHDGASAFQFTRSWLPHLVIVDVILGDMDGFELRRLLREDRATTTIPVLLVTGKASREVRSRMGQLGSDGFVYKEDFKKYLLRQVSMLLRQPAAQIYPGEEPDATLAILCRPNSREVVMRLSGDSSRLELVECRQAINPSDFADPQEWPASAPWREMASYYGRLIFDSLFSTPEAMNLYDTAVRAAGTATNLRLRISAPSELLRVPFEFLYQKNPPDENFYVVLRHPFARTITGREIRRIPLGRQFLNRLGGRSLPILLIGSDPDGELANVRDELVEVKAALESGFRSRGIRAPVDVMEPREASYEAVCKALNECKYDIVHFAGHGFYNSDSPDLSGLLFFTEGDPATKACLTANKLAELLRNSQVRFLYLSCCESGSAAGTERQGRYDLLGLADGAIRGGVASVMTSRFVQKDLDLSLVASTFYQHLTANGDLDRSLWLTRRAHMNPLHNTRWISPVLFIQR